MPLIDIPVLAVCMQDVCHMDLVQWPQLPPVF